MKTIEDLTLYQKARAFRIQISEIANRLPSSERFRLVDQMIRSSRSITAQIAEGHGRFHYKENVQYCRIARGSLEETQDHLNVAFDEGYISDQEVKRMLQSKHEISRMLNGYINFLKEAASRSE